MEKLKKPIVCLLADFSLDDDSRQIIFQLFALLKEKKLKVEQWKDGSGNHWKSRVIRMHIKLEL